jgi:hypothetical protein
MKFSAFFRFYDFTVSAIASLGAAFFGLILLLVFHESENYILSGYIFVRVLLFSYFCFYLLTVLISRLIPNISIRGQSKEKILIFHSALLLVFFFGVPQHMHVLVFLISIVFGLLLFNQFNLNRLNIIHYRKLLVLLSIILILIYVSIPKYINAEFNPSANTYSQINSLLTSDNDFIEPFELSVLPSSQFFYFYNKANLCDYVGIEPSNCDSVNLGHLAFRGGWGEDLLHALFVKQDKLLRTVNTYNFIAFNQGFISHHYNSISYYLSQTPKVFFKSQYGFGPIYLCYLVKNIYPIANVDAIFLATMLVNMLLVLIVGFYKFSSDEKKNLHIFIFLLVGLLTVFSTSSYLAPFLFPIRCLPSILLLVYLFNNNAKLSLIELILYSIIAVYNFEYAIFTFFSIGITSLLFKDLSRFISSLFFAFISCFLYQKLGPDVSGSYLFYFSTLNQLGLTDTPLIIFGLMTAITYLIFIQYILSRHQVRFIQCLLAVFFAMCFLKVIWVNSSNHISFMYFILGLFIATFNTKKLTNYSRYIKFINFSLVAIFTYSLILFFNPISPRFEFVKYSNHFSRFFYLEEATALKVIDVKKIYKVGDVVLSRADTQINLYGNIASTGDIYDFSTNLNNPKLRVHIDDIVKSAQRLLVDKDLYLDFDEYIIDKKIKGKFGYISSELTSLAKSRGYIKCEDTNYFEVYCK